MKVVILAGGYGTRILEESSIIPKPMIEIGGMPMIWHIMKLYSYYGFNEFIICAGYKQHIIKKWFADYFLNTSDVTFDFSKGGNEMIIHNQKTEPWKVSVIDTGLDTMTGGRIKRIQKYVGNETFMVTYGDGVGDVNIKEVLEQHKRYGNTGTLTVYNFGQNKGIVELDSTGKITDLREKSNFDGDLINIGFMVFEPELFKYIEGDDTVFEKEPMQYLIEQQSLDAYIHTGYWQCMDTQREKKQLEHCWESGKAPWKIW